MKRVEPKSPTPSLLQSKSNTAPFFQREGSREDFFGSSPALSASFQQEGQQSAPGNGNFFSPLPIQRQASTPSIQRSALSDSVEKLWNDHPNREAVFDRLSQDDAFANRTDTDLQKSLSKIFTDPNDLWLARKVLDRQLNESGGKYRGKALSLPIELFFFQGMSSEKALVIAGVHGTEQQGIEVARMLVADLGKQQPYYNVVLIPSLFPVNAKNRDREGLNQTNRNFPERGARLKDAKKDGGGTPLDDEGEQILIENQLLIQLIERFQPSRIISIHGTWDASRAGVFSDEITEQPDYSALRRLATDLARESMMFKPGNPWDPEQKKMIEVRETIFQILVQEFKKSNAVKSQHDVDLSVKTAEAIAAATNSIAGLQDRHTTAEIVDKIGAKEGTPTRRAAIESIKQNPAVAGNKLDQPQKSAVWGGAKPKGVSLGGYAPSFGISVFTVEPAINQESSTYPQKSLDPSVKQTERVAELQAYATAIRTILLGK